MANIELVIKIDESIYKELFADGEKLLYIGGMRSGKTLLATLVRAVRNGTPLPKGHGRLIDADSIYQIVRPIEQSDAEWGMTAETAIRLMHDVFNKAPTFIEADKESEEA